MLTLPLLRSVLRLTPTDPESTLAANLRTLRAEVQPDGIDRELLTWAGSVAERSGQVPDLVLAHEHFMRRAANGHPDGPAALLRIEEIAKVLPPLFDEASFRVALDLYKEEVMTEITTAMLIESAQILKNGVTTRKLIPGKGWQNVTVRGVEPALDHLNLGLRKLEARLKVRTTQGDFREDMDMVLRDYERAERDPGANVGVLTGIDRIDDVHHGLKRGELALILAFTSHMKTTFCLNWFYKAAVYHGKDVAMASLETRTDIIRDLLVCLHSTHPKFGFDPSEIRITFDRMRAGGLTPIERQALVTIKDDLRDCTDYGRMIYKQPEEQMTVGDIFRWVETEQRSSDADFELLVIDYLGLVDPEKGQAVLGDFGKLNLAIRLAKLAGLEFNHGKGIGVVSPFQASRKGYEEAEKAGGRYTLRALSGANEAERSSDFVYYLYLDDSMRDNGELAVGNIKARQTAMLTTQFRCYADPATRLIDNLDLSDPTQAKVQGGI